MTKYSNRELRQMILEERKKNVIILNEAVEFSRQLNVAEKKADKKTRMIELYEMSKWYKIGKYFKFF